MSCDGSLTFCISEANPSGLDQVLGDINFIILDHDSIKELLNTVRVPLADRKLLRHLLIFIKQLNSFMN